MTSVLQKINWVPYSGLSWRYEDSIREVLETGIFNLVASEYWFEQEMKEFK